MAYATIPRMIAVRSVFDSLAGRVEELDETPVRIMAGIVLNGAVSDLQRVIDNRNPNAGTGFRQGIASVEIAAGYTFGAFVEAAKAAAVDSSMYDDALDSQLSIACSYVEAGMAVLLAGLEIGENPVTGLL